MKLKVNKTLIKWKTKKIKNQNNKDRNEKQNIWNIVIEGPKWKKKLLQKK
jgi:hypothetical protein